MKRVLVLGCPGSGKSYFSKKLATKVNLPLTHLDNIYWNKDKVSCSREEFIAKLNPLLDQDEWILDGNYHHTLDIRLERCTDVFFLDLSREELIDWTKDYQEKTRPLELLLLAEHPNINVVIFYSRKEIDEYLESL